MLLSTFVAAGVARALVGLPILKTFWPLLAAVLLSEAVAAPVIILADAATQQAAEAAGSDYGRVRLFGAVGLGAFSPLNGLLVTRFGNGAGFLAGAAAWLSASCLTAMLPVSGLSAAAARGQRPAGRRAASEAGGGSSCCGGRLPLPLPAPAPAAEKKKRGLSEGSVQLLLVVVVLLPLLRTPSPMSRSRPLSPHEEEEEEDQSAREKQQFQQQQQKRQKGRGRRHRRQQQRRRQQHNSWDRPGLLSRSHPASEGPRRPALAFPPTEEEE